MFHLHLNIGEGFSHKDKGKLEWKRLHSIIQQQLKGS